MKVVKKLIKYFFLGIYTIIIYPFKCLFIGIKYICMPSKRDEIKYKGKPIVPLLILALSLSIYFISIFLITRWYVQNLKLNYLTDTIISNTKIIEQVENESNNTYLANNNDTTITNTNELNESYLEADFQPLLEQNKDTVGWIRVKNTNIDYAVVQYSDNEYYLTHDFNKNYSIYGWVFADYRDDFSKFNNNTIIYAHNTRRETMFATLLNCLNESWYSNEENLYIKISTPTSNTIWKVFSIYTTSGDDVYYLKTQFADKSDYQEFLDTLISRSINNFNEKLDTNNKILTLSTCDNTGRKRVVVHAKMVGVMYR